ncbi:hypothetical protein B5M09_006970 [Aphanomyces astaci]|uniref:Uncharacterized protein n=1 Tax=Aphanomyces astaci TaxID=112090 RepID=A0A3R7XV96_APHAT|nr:hypothetical protein B5M09_006970 [Aphanomyces astaci]
MHLSKRLGCTWYKQQRDDSYKATVMTSLVGPAVLHGKGYLADVHSVQLEQHVLVEGEKLERAITVFAQLIAKDAYDNQTSATIMNQGVWVTIPSFKKSDRHTEKLWTLDAIQSCRVAFISAVKTAVAARVPSTRSFSVNQLRPLLEGVFFTEVAMTTYISVVLQGDDTAAATVAFTKPFVTSVLDHYTTGNYLEMMYALVHHICVNESSLDVMPQLCRVTCGLPGQLVQLARTSALMHEMLQLHVSNPAIAHLHAVPLREWLTEFAAHATTFLGQNTHSRFLGVRQRLDRLVASVCDVPERFMAEVATVSIVMDACKHIEMLVNHVAQCVTRHHSSQSQVDLIEHFQVTSLHPTLQLTLKASEVFSDAVLQDALGLGDHPLDGDEVKRQRDVVRRRVEDAIRLKQSVQVCVYHAHTLVVKTYVLHVLDGNNRRRCFAPSWLRSPQAPQIKVLTLHQESQGHVYATVCRTKIPLSDFKDGIERWIANIQTAIDTPATLDMLWLFASWKFPLERALAARSMAHIQNLIEGLTGFVLAMRLEGQHDVHLNNRLPGMQRAN